MSEMHYYSNYAETRDIDCFFRVGDKAYHFASNGQPIPAFVTRKTNMRVQDAVYELLENAKGEVEVNTQIVQELIQREFDGIEGAEVDKADLHEGIERMIVDYAESFVGMARLGFVSMDLDGEGVFHVYASTFPHGGMKKREYLCRSSVSREEILTRWPLGGRTSEL